MKRFSRVAASVSLACSALLYARPTNDTTGGTDIQAPSNCFPGLGFTMPSKIPSSLNNWWCPYNTEYGFVGFGYEITACQSLNQLRADFQNIRRKFNGRYVRIYGACDNRGYYNDIVEAAWDANIGVFALIWARKWTAWSQFGFDGNSDDYKRRRDALFDVLHSNPKAKFITRAVQFGSEPLFDRVISAGSLIKEVEAAKSDLAGLHISVTVSDFAYSFMGLHAGDGGPQLLASLDIITAHILPFFSPQASTGLLIHSASNLYASMLTEILALKSWPIVTKDLDIFILNGNAKKIWFTQNGWPSGTGPDLEPNSPLAVANVQNEGDYYALLDAHCADLKNVPGGGVGWFAHIYSDDMELYYGIYDQYGNMKFPFSARTSC